MKTPLISKTQLQILYLNEKLSTDKIASIFNCNHVTVLNYLIRYNIPRRSKLGNRKPISITREILFDLYVSKKLSHKKIASQFGYSRYEVQSLMKKYKIPSRSYSESNTKYPKFNFNQNLLEKAYLIGFRLGDLNVYQRRELVQVRCSTTIQKQIDLITDLFKNYGHPTIWKAKRGTLEIIVLLNKSFNFLLPKQDLIENWILKNKTYFLSFLSGYSDAEGSFYLRNPYKKAEYSWGIFEIQTYDKNILSIISQYLLSLGIRNKLTLSKIAGTVDKKGLRYNKNAWKITIARKQDLWNYIKLIESYHKHKNKLRDLQKIKENLIMRNNMPYCRKIIF